jgi:hypothetical protein
VKVYSDPAQISGRDIELEGDPRGNVWSSTYRSIQFVLQYLLDESYYFRR